MWFTHFSTVILPLFHSIHRSFTSSSGTQYLSQKDPFYTQMQWIVISDWSPWTMGPFWRFHGARWWQKYILWTVIWFPRACQTTQGHFMLWNWEKLFLSRQTVKLFSTLFHPTYHLVTEDWSCAPGTCPCRHVGPEVKTQQISHVITCRVQSVWQLNPLTKEHLRVWYWLQLNSMMKEHFSTTAEP